MIAAGIDLGGTKIEAQVFDEAWQVAARNRVTTPQSYDALVQELVAQIGWIDKQAGKTVPVGIGAAGLINPQTGLAFTANLPATGRPLPQDINQAVGRNITYLNDCRAMALSEAKFGAGQGHNTVLSLILGTGVGGGVAINGRLMHGPTMTGGEFGHTPAPVHLVSDYQLPIVGCGCGQRGCIETYIGGPGMTRIAETVLGAALDPAQISDERSGTAKQVWDMWIALTASHLRSLTMTIDPDVIVLGGGLSKMHGVADALSEALSTVQFLGFGVPPIVIAEGGDTSGARGAAYAALLETEDA